MKDDYNPFLDCYVYESEHGTGWLIVSKYWNLHCIGKEHGEKIVRIIQSAYHAGREDTQKEVKQALGIPHEE